MPTVNANLTTPVTSSSLNTGLTAWWRCFPNGTYTSTVSDLIGTETLTCANGATLTASGFNNSKVFILNGTTAAVGSAGDSAIWDITTATGNFTLGSWIYLNDTGFAAIMTQNTGDGLGWWLYYDAGYLILGFSRTSGSRYAGWAWTPSTSTWYGITVTKNGTNYECFVNGVSLGVFPENFTWVNRSGQFVCGALNSAGIYELNGRMDNIRIYSRALSTNEVKSLYGEDLTNDPTVINWNGQGARPGGLSISRVSKLTSGGARPGGTASVGRLYRETATGGARSGGTASVGYVASVQTSGGGRPGSSGQPLCRFEPQASGGTRTSGSSSPSLWTALEASGGLVAGSEALPVKLSVLTSAGGAVAGGNTSVKFDELGTGGARTSGTAVLSLTKFAIGSGGVVLSGQALVVHQHTYNEVGSGGVLLGANNEPEVSYTMIDSDFRAFLIVALGDLWAEPGKIVEGQYLEGRDAFHEGEARIWFQRRNTVEELMLNEPSGMATTGFDVEVWSDDLNECQELARAIRQAVIGYRGMMGATKVYLAEYEDQEDDYQPRSARFEGEHSSSLDVAILHKTTS